MHTIILNTLKAALVLSSLIVLYHAAAQERHSVAYAAIVVFSVAFFTEVADDHTAASRTTRKTSRRAVRRPGRKPVRQAQQTRQTHQPARQATQAAARSRQLPAISQTHTRRRDRRRGCTVRPMSEGQPRRGAVLPQLPCDHARHTAGVRAVDGTLTAAQEARPP